MSGLREWHGPELPANWHDQDVVKLGRYGKTNPHCWQAYRDVIAARKAFDAGHLHGRPYHDGIDGDMPPEYRGKVDGAQYVIKSYNTPIAWLDADGVWWLPSVSYSITTSEHQWTARTAISQLPETVNLPKGEQWRSLPHIVRRKGRGKSPYGPRQGW